jgi:hypothetical protein
MLSSEIAVVKMEIVVNENGTVLNLFTGPTLKGRAEFEVIKFEI